MVEPDDWRIRNQETYLSSRTFYLHQYELRFEEDDHAHCEFCWEKFNLYAETSQVGYSTLDDMYWICPPCYDDFAELFSFRIWDPCNYKELEIQHILNLEIGCSNGLENIYRVDRVLRLLIVLQQIDAMLINGRITPLIVNTSFPTGKAPHISIVDEGETEICSGTISDFRTILIRISQSFVQKKEIEVRYDNLYIRYIAINQI